MFIAAPKISGNSGWLAVRVYSRLPSEFALYFTCHSSFILQDNPDIVIDCGARAR